MTSCSTCYGAPTVSLGIAKPDAVQLEDRKPGGRGIARHSLQSPRKIKEDKLILSAAAFRAGGRIIDIEVIADAGAAESARRCAAQAYLGSGTMTP